MEKSIVKSSIQMCHCGKFALRRPGDTDCPVCYQIEVLGRALVGEPEFLALDPRKTETDRARVLVQ
jgi:hypothetical protein